ncbi:MAG: hemolysin III family protein, partial [Nitriliruptoraceae bacterium]
EGAGGARHPRPVAAIGAVPATIAWIASVSTTVEQLGVAAFAGGITAMFVASALLHLRPWPPETHEPLLRLDHTGIFLAIGGTAVAVGLLGLHGWSRAVLVGGALVGTVLGIVLEWLPFAPPRGYSNAIYLTLGWLSVLLLPWVWAHSGAAVALLIIAGGVPYTVGAVIVGLRRPDPLPRWFGYHEVFHLLVILAVIAHAAAIGRLTSS